MSKQYRGVLDMAKALTDDKDFQKDLERELADRDLARLLFSLRCAHNITQDEMAKRLNCSQGRISKLERSPTEDIKVGDLAAYARELGLQVSISFDQKRTAVEWVKHHVLALKEHLDLLAGLAHKDDKIREGVSGFFWETLFNALRVVMESADKLPKTHRVKEPLMHVSGPVVISEKRSLIHH